MNIKLEYFSLSLSLCTALPFLFPSVRGAYLIHKDMSKYHSNKNDFHSTLRFYVCMCCILRVMADRKSRTEISKTLFKYIVHTCKFDDICLLCCSGSGSAKKLCPNNKFNIVLVTIAHKTIYERNGTERQQRQGKIALHNELISIRISTILLWKSAIQHSNSSSKKTLIFTFINFVSIIFTSIESKRRVETFFRVYSIEFSPSFK